MEKEEWIKIYNAKDGTWDKDDLIDKAYEIITSPIKTNYDLINRQKEEIERLNKNYEELIYKTECLLCHATGNKFSKYIYTTQEMISFVDDYIQDCCDEAVEEAKEAVKSEAIKEFVEKLKETITNAINTYYNSNGGGYYLAEDVIEDIDNLVKEMTEIETDKALHKINHNSLCETDTYEVGE